jgi:hypothetical protein
MAPTMARVVVEGSRDSNAGSRAPMPGAAKAEERFVVPRRHAEAAVQLRPCKRPCAASQMGAMSEA